MPEARINLLSLDNGGIYGLSSLFVLEKLMSDLGVGLLQKPCDIFDMIGGTGTGG